MKTQVDPLVLHGSWFRSPEEDTPTEVVYRPASYHFPPSRGREGMQLLPDGTMVHAGIGPTDVAHHRKGRWRLEDTVLHLDFEEPTATRRALDLVEASTDRLVAKR